MKLPPRAAGPSALALGLAMSLAVFAAGTASARPQIRRDFFTAYPAATGSRLDNLPSHATHCGVCHFNFNGGGTRNPYGSRVQQVYQTTGIASIGGEDSDGDGYTNNAEITDLVSYSNTPTFPGLTPSNVGSTSNVPNLGEITPYLVPTPAGDVTPPNVTVNSPNGGQSWTGGSSYTVTWLASDNVGVTRVDLHYREHDADPWQPIALNLANTGSFTWFVPNTPATTAKVRAVAWDQAGNQQGDESNAHFTIVRQPGGIVPTTLRDFKQPGTQPLGGGTFQEHGSCMGCHGGYDTAVEPGHNFEGMMMGQAARDPLFYACLAIAEQDAPSSGDLCIRCHSPFGWLAGRSTPTDASQLTALDRDGVACEFCHRLVDPIYQAGASPAEDQPVLNALLPAHRPATYSNGQFVIDPNPRKRGPFTTPIAPHEFLNSAFHRSSEICATCHDVSNPAFTRTGLADYAPGPLDQAADSISSLTLMPLERTYSEWKNSPYPAGVYAPEFAGNKPDGVVATCQDCHLRDVNGPGCNDAAAPVRADLPLHDMTGGNAWIPLVVSSLYPGETNATALADAADRARGLLAKAAVLGLATNAEGDSFRAIVTVTNRSGHKLPTGYPEGRRIWLHVVARDESDQVVFESGAYDPATGVLTHDPHARIYETHLGISPGLGAAIGVAHGSSFHFALNDSIYKDNRIPPLGFTNAAFETFGGKPVDHDHPGPGPRYADGQNWDVSEYPLPSTARSVKVEMYYQTMSKEYVEFLLAQNTTNGAGATLYNAWLAHGRAAPVLMGADSVTIGPLDVGDRPGAGPVALSMVNPFRGALSMRLDLERPGRVAYEVYDVRGRRLARVERGLLGGGAHRLDWDGSTAAGSDAGAGTFWVRVLVNDEKIVRRVVRLM